MSNNLELCVYIYINHKLAANLYFCNFSVSDFILKNELNFS